MSMPTTQIGDVTISRLICGANPFSGISHQSYERDQEMKDFYTVARIKQTLKECESLGINTLLARADNHIRRMLKEYWNEGGKIHWIAQTPSEWGSLRDSIIAIVETGASAAFIHGSTVDQMYLDGRIDELAPLFDLIHSAKLPAGLGSHNPDVIRYVERKGWATDFYIMSFYDVVNHDEFYYDEDRENAVELIREIDKPCVVIKALAAGRHDPKTALKFAYENIKPIDAIAVGTFCKERPDEMRINAELCATYGAAKVGA